MVDLGILIALKQLKIEVSLISGTSMGAVIGALYASGLKPEEIREKAIGLFSRDGVMQALIQDRKYPGLPLSSGEKLIEELIKMAGWDPEFYELSVPLFIVAADKVSQQSVILRYGKVFDAVRASLAMPLLLDEKQMGGMQLLMALSLHPWTQKHFILRERTLFWPCRPSQFAALQREKCRSGKKLNRIF